MAPSQRASPSPPSSAELRSLVLDYLCHSGYANTARALARGSAAPRLDADGDEIMSSAPDAAPLPEDALREARTREEIRHHLLCGEVDAATEVLAREFPSVLSAEAETLVAAGPSSANAYVPRTSVDPAHLVLNLRIQAFIEACRTRPLAGPGADSTDALPPQLSEEELIAKGTKLYALAKRLPSARDRRTYEEELGHVSALLLYRPPEDERSLAKYMSQARRAAVAEQINSAILYRAGRPVISRLEHYTRYTSTIWSFMHDLRIKAKPGAPVPPVSASDAATAPHSKAGAPEEQPVPQFRMQDFLDARS
ncbi:hypothetical protein BD626DRAFT_548509 [Schizophyllum amplum]|uniref:CRA domain-containing protein n=1 Tax=Schizophyllum amplum TaxID=97359 RepID=A0A550CDA0_9AGAR|nr:hypothetical protein BD626DRAFT_548509 [Auriculariopsis ampla]